MNDRPIGVDPGALVPVAPLAPPLLDPELQVAHALPREHPQWMRDVLSVSTRARALIAKIKPLAVKVLTFWDHQLRELRIGHRKLGVDASGSYRLT